MDAARAARLRRNADIAAVRREGREFQHRLFALRVRRNSVSTVRLAVSAPKSLGRAVVRNRARRRLRETFRVAIGELLAGNGYDLLIVARKPLASAPHRALREGARLALRSLPETGAN